MSEAVAAGDPGTCQSLGVGGSWKSSSSSPSLASQDPPKPSLGVARHKVRAARDSRHARPTPWTGPSIVAGSAFAPRRVGPVDRRRPTNPSLLAHALAEANAGVGSARSMRAGSRARRGRDRRGSYEARRGVRRPARSERSPFESWFGVSFFVFRCEIRSATWRVGRDEPSLDRRDATAHTAPRGADRPQVTWRISSKR
jgi:hypothetical protein